MKQPDECQLISIPQLAKRWGLGRNKVMAWAMAGKIGPVYDLSLGQKERRRFMVRIEDAEAFLAGREVRKPERKQRRRTLDYERHF